MFIFTFLAYFLFLISHIFNIYSTRDFYLFNINFLSCTLNISFVFITFQKTFIILEHILSIILTSIMFTYNNFNIYLSRDKVNS